MNIHVKNAIATLLCVIAWFFGQYSDYRGVGDTATVMEEVTSENHDGMEYHCTASWERMHIFDDTRANVEEVDIMYEYNCDCVLDIDGKKYADSFKNRFGFRYPHESKADEFTPNCHEWCELACTNMRADIENGLYHK